MGFRSAKNIGGYNYDYWKLRVFLEDDRDTKFMRGNISLHKDLDNRTTDVNNYIVMYEYVLSGEDYPMELVDQEPEGVNRHILVYDALKAKGVIDLSNTTHDFSDAVVQN